MKSELSFLALCALSSHLLQAAAKEEAKQSISKIPRHIKLHLSSPNSIILTPGGSYTIKIPLGAIEPVTGKTFTQRFQETAAIGLPLILVHSIYASKLGLRAETFDLCAAIRAYKAWDEHILTADTTIIDCKDIEKSMHDAEVAYLRISLPQSASYVHAANIRGAIGPLHTDMHSAEYNVECNKTDKRPLTLQNAELTKIAVLYELTKDSRALFALYALYRTSIVQEDLPSHKEALQRLVKTFKGLE